MRKTGMDPFFAFIETVKDSLRQIRDQWRMMREYERSIQRGGGRS